MTPELIEAVGLWIVLPMCATVGLIVAFGIDIRIKRC